MKCLETNKTKFWKTIRMIVDYPQIPYKEFEDEFLKFKGPKARATDWKNKYIEGHATSNWTFKGYEDYA